MKKTLLLLMLFGLCSVTSARDLSFESPPGVSPPNLEFSYASTGWLFMTGGVGTAAHTQFGEATPTHRSQAAAIYNSYYDNIYLMAFQGFYDDIYVWDFAGVSEPNDIINDPSLLDPLNGLEITVTFDATLGYTSVASATDPNTQGYPALACWWQELVSDGEGGIAGFRTQTLLFNDWVGSDPNDDPVPYDGWDNVVCPTVTLSSDWGLAYGQTFGYRIDWRTYAWVYYEEDIPGDYMTAEAYVLVDNITGIPPYASGKCPLGDLDGDCDCDIDDFVIFARSWLLDCEADPGNPNCVVP